MISSSLCSHAASKLSIGREGRVQQTGGFLIKKVESLESPRKCTLEHNKTWDSVSSS